jgi:hypothetical protein
MKRMTLGEIATKMTRARCDNSACRYSIDEYCQTVPTLVEDKNDRLLCLNFKQIPMQTREAEEKNGK